MGRLIWFSQILCIRFILLQFQAQCSSLSPNSPPHLCRPQEHFALLDFRTTISVKNCFGYYRYTIQAWNESIDCCLWEGITCNKMTGHVVGLDLSESCIAANLTSNSSLFFLEKLQSLNLGGNYISYPNISFRFQGWKSLTYLNLTDTGLIHSSLLFEISLLSKLVSLDLSDNHDLLFDNTKFKLLVHNLTELRLLFLDSVNMSSVLPSSLLNLTFSSEQLSLGDCSLQGNFPNQVFHLPSLQLLDISENSNLRCHLPKSNWSSPLKYLHLDDINFSRELPHSLGNLKLLEGLSLFNCQFYGSIPLSFANLTKITYIILGFNHFEGQIPDVFEKMHKLSSLYLNANNFDGELPASVFNLTHLTYLNVQSNRLTTPLPANVTGLSNLGFLSMSDNLLKGRIPSWLFSLAFMFSIDLSYNRLDSIDHTQKPNIFLKYVNLSNNEISGSIPSFLFDHVNLFEVRLSSNNLSGTVTPNMLSKLVYLKVLDLSHNSLLSLSNNDTTTNYTFPFLSFVQLSSCNIHKFPSFLVKSMLLWELDVSNNKILGEIHKWEIENLVVANLNLSYNFLTGIDLSSLRLARVVDLRSNLLQGSLPIILSVKVDFFISKNYLTGEIPPSFCNLTSLSILDLSWNSLGGKIPACFGNLTSLFVLDLRMNKFHGRIPNSFFNISWLEILNLNGNQLEGILPPSLGYCRYLEVIDVGNNYLNDTFPHWLGVLPNLYVLILRSNRFHGAMSNSMPGFYFPQLTIIDVSHNDFMGLLPSNYFKNLKAMRNVHLGQFEKMYINDNGYYKNSVTVVMKGLEVELVKILKTFTTIDFSSNRFHGEIPKDLGELNSLHLVNLSHNSLTGQIPSSFGNMAELESLDLSSNKLDGRIPEQLTNLTFLSVLNLSHNKLVGHIPQGKQFDTFSNDSYIGNSGLCGLPLTKKCNEEPESPPSKFEDDSTAIFDWKFALMGCGCGLVLGFSVGYIVFTIGKPWWLVKKVEMYQQKFVGRCNRRQKKRRNQQPNRRS